MITVTLYRPATGELVQTLSGPALDILKNLPSGMDMVDGAWASDLYWVSDGRVMPRPQLGVPAATLLVDGAAVWAADLPPGTWASISFARDAGGNQVPRSHANKYPFAGPIEDGVLQFSTAFAGVYRVTLLPPHPWRRAEIDLVAVAP